MAYKDKLLLGICDKLQLQPHLYKLAEKRYGVIADIIQEDDAFSNIELRIYPHGSFKLKTTVRPIGRNEYDLDFVAEIPVNSDMTPRQLYNHIYRILSTDKNHSDMIEKKTRCIRVNYANDFHIDIMPGQAVDRISNEIIVPDRELKGWYHHSNPIGYADWFEDQARTKILHAVYESGQICESTELIDNQEIVAHLEPLRRAVQLIKRYRDLYCEKNNTEPVRSIVLCTLMGKISSQYSTELDIMSDFCTYVNKLIINADGIPFEVNNPVVDEVLTEKWEENPRNYIDFVDMMQKFTKDIAKLKAVKNNIEIITQVQSMFGEKITNEVVKEAADAMNTARAAGLLSIGETGHFNTMQVGVAVRKNTFYGE